MSFPTAFHLLLWTLVVTFVRHCEAEVYTSIQDLTAVFELESRVVKELRRYLRSTEDRMLKIRKYIEDYDQVVSETSNLEEPSLEILAGNPLHAFHLMKRLTVDWRHIEEQAKQDAWKGVTDVVRSGVLGTAHRLGVRMPRDEDLHGAAQAIIRLHDVYKLNTTEFARGNVLGMQSAAELTAQDCLYMGKHSFNLGMYSRAVDWFEEAYSLAGREGNSTVTQAQVGSFLNTALKALEEQSLESEEETTKSTSYRLAPDLTIEEDARNFQALCRGEQMLSSTYQSTLKCYFDDRGDSYFLLMPTKVEVHHHDPLLLTFHQVLSEAEIEEVKRIAEPLMARAMVQGVKGNGNLVSSTRTSKVAWLDDNFHPLISKLGDRIERMTQLSTDIDGEHAELLQVANYGIGGHYNPHHDYLLVDKSEEEMKKHIHPRELVMGDRIATFMFYLSDVTRGGATAFPRIGTAVWPTRGAAAFWYNLKSSGAGDPSTLHGACPVVHGSKWVGNKWIRERGQFARRPCGLSPDL